MDTKYVLTMFVVTVLALLGGFYLGYNYGRYTRDLGSIYIRVSTTTSLYQLGVLNDLLNDFINSTGLNMKFEVLVKGSGEALKLLADGSTCIAFVHAPSLELKYLMSGEVERLAIFAYNEFVVLGPGNDPANVSKALNAVDAFKRIYLAGEKGLAKFVSRGDFSGTHVRELLLWNLSGYSPEGRSWYLRSGQGMVQTLFIADNLNAYTLSDEATYLYLEKQGKLSNLVILFKDPVYLINVYSVYLSRSKPCDNPLTWYIAYKLKDYLLTRGQELIKVRYRGLLNPVEDSKEVVFKAWENLARVEP
jgi:tungstate transport system substrate-binding protein